MVDAWAVSMADSVVPVLLMVGPLSRLIEFGWPLDIGVVCVWRWSHLLYLALHLGLSEVCKFLVSSETILLL